MPADCFEQPCLFMACPLFVRSSLAFAIKAACITIKKGQQAVFDMETACRQLGGLIELWIRLRIGQANCRQGWLLGVF